MKYIRKIFLTLLGILIFSISHGQDLEVAQILSKREASTQALRAFDADLNALIRQRTLLLPPDWEF